MCASVFVFVPEDQPIFEARQTRPIRVPILEVLGKMNHVVDARTRVLQEESSRAVLVSHRDPKDDLQVERSRANFPVTELMHYLIGGKDKYEKK